MSRTSDPSPLGSSRPDGHGGALRWGLRFWSAAAVVLVLLCSTATGLAALSLARSQDARSRQAFDYAATEVASTLALAIQHEQDLAVSARGFVVDHPQATQPEFERWTRSTEALRRYPELSSLGYVVIVSPAGVADFAKRSLADPPGVVPPDGGFDLSPPGQRSFYCLTRLGRARDATGGTTVGNDYCAGDPGPPSALARRDYGPGTYLPVKLGGENTLVITIPVYAGGVTPQTATGRGRAFLGWIGMSVAPTQLLQRALVGHPSTAVSMHYRVGASDVVFSSGSSSRGDESVGRDLHNGWTVTTSGPPVSTGLLHNRGGQALGVSGLVLSLLFGILLYVLGTGRGRALRLVSRKTGELQYLALHDPLTGLPNRALILDRVGQALARASRQGTDIGLMFIDLDGFKDINDTFGHAAGDALLCAVAERLSLTLRGSDTVGRLSGDEFVVLLEGAVLEGGAEPVAERIQAVLSGAFHLRSPHSVVVHIHASIGIAVGLRTTAEELLRDADVALYEAKDAGKDCYVLFAPEMQTAVHDRLELEMDLRDSIGTNEFFLVYQPIVDLTTLQPIGVEALLRWRHPVRGIVLPDQFIPVAEQTGMIVALGRWVLAQACWQAADWQRRGHPLSISVNVSPRQLDGEETFLRTVSDVLADTGLDPTRLTLEITETVLMRDATTSADRLRALKRLGVRLAIDDFGTGYSSMAYLQQFPVDALKIDRSFISGIASSPESPALIRTLVQLGRTFGIETVAEGIEEPEQLERLQREGCDSGQGYLFSRPLPVDDLEAWLGLRGPDQPGVAVSAGTPWTDGISATAAPR